MNLSSSKYGALLRTGWVLSASLCLLACANKRGAGTVEGTDFAAQAADRKYAQAPFDEQARQAILRERALYDSHFVAGTAKLTPRAERELAVLAEAMLETGGRLSVERGSVRATLHTARLESVRNALARSGIAPDRVLLDEAGPGGAGSTSSEALRVLDAARREPMRLPTSGILSTATTGGTQ